MSSSLKQMTKEKHEILPFLSKPRFIWRYPPSKFLQLPSCNPKQSNDVRFEPLNFQDELLQRQKLSVMIYELGYQLHLSFTSIYVGVIYMHRFFMVHPFQNFFKELVAAACLFLSSKVNETSRGIDDIVQHLHALIHQEDYLGEALSPEIKKTMTAAYLTEEIAMNYKQLIIDYENILLSTLGFCLHVEQPYRIITKLTDTLTISNDIVKKAHDIVTYSVFFTRFSVKYTANLIACFALYFVFTSLDIQISENSDGSQWFQIINEEFTEKILQELIDEYLSNSFDKSAKRYQQRLEQLHQRNTNETTKAFRNVQEQSNLNIPIDDDKQSVHSMTANNVSFENTSDHLNAKKRISCTHTFDLDEINNQHQRTPTYVSLLNVIQVENSSYYQPPLKRIYQDMSSPKKQKASSYQSLMCNSMSKSSAKPIPTLMSSSNIYSSHHHLESRYYSRFATPIFSYRPLIPPTQSNFHLRAPTIPPQSYHHPHLHSFTYTSTSTYPSQQPSPLLYHTLYDSNPMNNKRYGEPPAAPIKRTRYSINMDQLN